MCHYFPSSLPNKNLFPMTRIRKTSNVCLIYGLTVWVKLLGLVISLEEVHWFAFSSWFSHALLCCLLFPSFRSVNLSIAQYSFWPRSTEINEKRQFWKKKDVSQKNGGHCVYVGLSLCWLYCWYWWCLQSAYHTGLRLSTHHFSLSVPYYFS